MSKHTWVKENIASYLAGGLDDAERERLEQHTSGCAECARALAEARAVDGTLETLFASERPQAMLEDWVIEGVRASTLPQPWRGLSRTGKVLVATAALVFLTVLGGGLTVLLEQEQLPFPGSARNASIALKSDFVGGTGFVVDDSGSMRTQTGLPQFATALETRVKQLGELVEEVRKESTARLHGLKRPLALETGSLTTETEKKIDTAKLEKAIGEATEKAKEAQARLDRVDRLKMGAGSRSKGLISAEDYGAAVLTRDKYVQELNKLIRDQKLVNGQMEVRRTKENKEGNPLLGFSPDGKALLSGGDSEKNKTVVQLWNAATGKPAPAHEFYVPATALVVRAKPQTVTEKVPEKLAKKRPEKQDPAEGKDKKAGEKQPEQPQDTGRKIIRTGEVDFEVDSFDTAAATVARLVNAVKGGFVTTTNSTKLPNGKVRGSVVVRVPPQYLDGLLLALRKELGKTGELKSQRIGSQDVTKQYTDLESRLKADRTMEERLLKIIRDGKGEIKDLLLAEKELGVVRTRIEELTGELRYYANLVALSTLTINLTEKEIRAAAQVCENERVQAGIEVEDVDKARQEALKEIAAVKGRVTRSELKQHAAGQFSALLHFEVPPDAAGALRDRLRQLGNMVRLEIDRVQQAGSAPVPPDTPIKRGDTTFVISLYNLANVAPRETVTLMLAVADVPAAYRALRAAVGKAKGRVITALLNEKDRQNVTAQLDFDVRRAGESGVLEALKDAGEVLSRQVARVAENENVTDAKLLYKVEVLSANAVPPRETVTLGIEVPDVDAALTLFTSRVKAAQGRTVQVQVGQERNGRVTARIVYDVPLVAASGLVEKFKASGHVRVQRVDQNAQAPEGKLAVARLDVTLSNGELLLPQEEGLGKNVRGGLAFSLRALSVSAGWLIVAILFVLPWVLLVWAVVWLARRLWGRGQTAAARSPASATGSGA